MRITEAAQRLGTSPRMLRYRDLLGLLPPVRATTPAMSRAPSGSSRGHRRFGDDEVAAVSHALRIEQRYDISPAALAFGLKVLTEPGVRADVAELGRRLGRIAPPPARALDFEQERARRLLRLPSGRAVGSPAPGDRPSPGSSPAPGGSPGPGGRPGPRGRPARGGGAPGAVPAPPPGG
jgi:MerR family copper efflux transcriptional regulator